MGDVLFYRLMNPRFIVQIYPQKGANHGTKKLCEKPLGNFEVTNLTENCMKLIILSRKRILNLLKTNCNFKNLKSCSGKNFELDHLI